MMNLHSFTGRTARWASAALVVVIAAVAAFPLSRAWLGTGGNPSANVLTFAAARGPLTISVVEQGTIRSREQVVLKNEVEGQTTILFLIEEGTYVETDDLLVELDASRLQEQKIEQQIKVENAGAAFIRARENLEVVRSQAESDVAKARLEHRFAVEDLEKYLNGDYPKELTEAKNRITIADADLAQARRRLAGSEELLEGGFISPDEHRENHIAVERRKLEFELAEESLKLLENWTHKRQLDELESNIEQTALALRRAEISAAADVAQAEEELRARELELTHQEAQLRRVEDQIAKTRIVAPTSGLVVYATTGRGGGWGGSQEPLAEGQTIRERQDLIYLPTAASVMAEVKVHESNLDKVRSGLPVRVTVDALPGRTFWGRVSRIAPMPDAQSIWANPDLKVYHTEIYIDGDGSALRTGMTCRAEIVVDRYEDAIYVPVQSVLRVDGQPMVYVHDGRETHRRPIELGLDNNRMARIIDGLREGEQVLLNPPLAEGTRLDEALAEAEQAQEPALSAAPVEAPAAADAAPDAVADAPLEGGGDREPRGGGEFGNRSPEQMQEMRRQFESLSPEEQQRLREQFQQRRRQQSE